MYVNLICFILEKYCDRNCIKWNTLRCYSLELVGISITK